MRRKVGTLFVVIGSAFSLVTALGGAQTPKTESPPVTPTPAPLAIGAPNPGGREVAWERKFYRVPAANLVYRKGNKVQVHPNFPPLYELIAIEGEDAIVRDLPPEDPDSPNHEIWKRAMGYQVAVALQEQYLQGKFLVTDLPDIAPDSIQRLEVREVPGMFPRQGQWQMSLDVADLNGDGLDDIVLPPARGGVALPTILLQEQDGGFSPAQARFPEDLQLDYGAVRIADFDGDGNPDLAFACHFKGYYVVYNEGDLKFLRWQELETAVKGVTGRSLVVADFNRDGRPDLAGLAEINIDFSTLQPFGNGLVNVWLNTKQGFKNFSATENRHLMGDWLAAEDINDDGYPDLLLTSRSQGVMDLVLLNEDGGSRFRSVASDVMPLNGFSFSNAVGAFDKWKKKDLLLCFEQFSPKAVDDPSQACAVYHFHDDRGRFQDRPQPQVVLKQKEPFNNLVAVVVADFDRDGRDDFAVGDRKGRVRLFLQAVPGRFFENTPPVQVYGSITDLKAVRLGKQRAPGVVVMGTTLEGKQGGGIWVYSFARRAFGR